MSANRITRREALAVGLATLVAARAGAAPVPKADPSWVGRTVMPKKYLAYASIPAPADLLNPPNPDGTPSELRLRLTAASYDVKAEQGTRAEVIEGNGTFAWVEKADVVLLADAVEHFTKAIKANEKDTFAINSRGWAYHLLDKPKEALKDFDEFLKLTPAEMLPPAGAPERWEGLVNRGLVQAEQGEFEKALADLEEVVGKWPGIGIARVNLGYTYELMGKYTEAAATYRNTSHLLGVNNLAWVRATCPDEKHRNGEHAVQLAKKACDATKDREGMYLDTLAAAYAEDGKFEDAVKAQERALTDKSYLIKYGEGGHKRLQLYKAKKPFRTEPVKQ